MMDDGDVDDDDDDEDDDDDHVSESSETNGLATNLQNIGHVEESSGSNRNSMSEQQFANIK
eukprot:9318009-Karenia_brevis.AAC.1